MATNFRLTTLGAQLRSLALSNPKAPSFVTESLLALGRNKKLR